MAPPSGHYTKITVLYKNPEHYPRFSNFIFQILYLIWKMCLGKLQIFGHRFFKVEIPKLYILSIFKISKSQVETSTSNYPSCRASWCFCAWLILLGQILILSLCSNILETRWVDSTGELFRLRFASLPQLKVVLTIFPTSPLRLLSLSVSPSTLTTVPSSVNISTRKYCGIMLQMWLCTPSQPVNVKFITRLYWYTAYHGHSHPMIMFRHTYLGG